MTMAESAWKTFNATRPKAQRPKRKGRRQVGHGTFTIDDEKLWLAAQAAGYEPDREVTGEDGFARFHRMTWKYHPQAKVCPGCMLDVSTTGITHLLYTHVVCKCRVADADYDHLVEQLWHINCFVASRSKASRDE